MELVVIGGIAAGMSIASKAQRTKPDLNITVYEMEDYISFGACGLPYYLGGKFDDGDMMMVRTPDQMRKKGIDVKTNHQVLDIDFDEKKLRVKDLVNDRVFEKDYDRLAIATGALAKLPEIEGSRPDNLYTITRLDEVDEIKKNLDQYEKVAIIGGGFIGVEAADQLAEVGKDVTILQRSQYLMRKQFDPEFSEKIAEALVEAGVNVELNSPVKDFVIESGRIKSLVTDRCKEDYDLVISAIGFRPNTSFIKDNRLERLDNGAIVIDSYGRTSIEDVYAAGDCATVYSPLMEDFYSPLATYANKMGRIVGINITGQEKKAYIGALASSVVKVGKYAAARTGLTESLANKLAREVKTSMIKSKNHAGYYPGQSDIWIKLVYDPATRAILGGQIFGQEGAAERIDALAIAVYKELTVDELGYMDFPYAPPFASTWEAMNIAGNAVK